MNSRQLAYFATIVDTGSITKAARELNIAQPALSQHIANLEDELGTALLIRSPRGVTTTAPGEVLYQHAQKIISQIKQATLEVKYEANTPRGEVSIVMPPMLGEHLAPRLVINVEDRYPEIDLNVTEALSLDSRRLVESGRVDLGVLAMNEPPATVETITLFEEPLFVVDAATNGDSSDESTVITFAELSEIPLVLSRKRHSVKELLEEASEKAEVDLAVRIESDAFRLYRGYVRSGVATAVWPWPSFHFMWTRGEVRARRIVEPDLRRSIHIAWPSEYPLSAASTAVKNIVVELISELHDQGVIRGELTINGAGAD